MVNLLGYLGTDGPSWRYVLYPIALILLMLLRPKGLLGTVEWGFFKAAPAYGGGTGRLGQKNATGAKAARSAETEDD